MTRQTQDSEIPSITTSQFDEYLFPGWKPPNYASYHQFHITRIESYIKHLKVPVLPHRRTVNFFVFLTEGSAIRSKGLNQYEIRPGHFYFLPADQITSLEYISEDAAGYYCHFSTEVFNHRLLKVNLAKDFPFFGLQSNPLYKISGPVQVLRILKILENEYKLGMQQRFELIPFYLISLFLEVQKQNLNPEAPKARNKAAVVITELYKDALQKFLYEKKNVADYAEYLSVSKNHLHKCIKAATGKSAHELLANMRILEAKVLLQQSNLSIGEIAFKIGKKDQSDFSRFFKSRTGMSPKAYRNINK